MRETPLRPRSAWTSSFTACLELAKQEDVALDQDGGFMPIQVSAGADPHREGDASQRNKVLSLPSLDGLPDRLEDAATVAVMESREN